MDHYTAIHIGLILVLCSSAWLAKKRDSRAMMGALLCAAVFVFVEALARGLR